MNKMNKAKLNTVLKKHIPFIIVFLMIMLFNGCKDDRTQYMESKPLSKIEQKTTINFIGHWYKEGKREDLVRNFVREYSLINQEVNINLKFPEEVYYNREDLYSNRKFVVSVLKEKKPSWDIVRLNSEYFEISTLLGDPDWPKKYLVDFSEIEEFRQGTLPELLTEKAKEEWNGIIPGPYIEGQFWALWCNLNVAKKLGIEIKQYGMTYSDFLGYIKAVYNYNQRNPSEYITPIYESADWPTARAIAVQLYASLLDSPEEFFLDKITDNRLNAWHKTLEAMEELSKYKPLNPNWQKVNWNNTTASLLNEECLFYVNGSWMYNIWENIDPKKTQNCMPAEFPIFGKQTVYPTMYQVMWGVLKNSPHRDEAVKFLLAMNKPSMAETWVRQTKCPTGIRGNLADISFGKDHFENFSYHVQTAYKDNSYRYSEKNAWILNNKNEDKNLFFNEVIEGKLTADEAFKKLKQQIGR